eukprot:scaffold1353_cov363-Pavlova_lutheri.AAC.9
MNSPLHFYVLEGWYRMTEYTMLHGQCTTPKQDCKLAYLARKAQPPITSNLHANKAIEESTSSTTTAVQRTQELTLLDTIIYCLKVT